uniref:C-type lectin domain-containing protein n=1 Tax=Chrysemys picta bellii TaxID=8478 RepID=A0A8C3HKU0_CHRPI
MFSFIFSLLFLLEFPPSSPWLLTVILGLLCLALLVTARVWVAMGKYLNMTGLYCSLFQGDKCSSCPEGWIQHRRKCYHFTHERSSWEKSREYCSSHSSRLLRIENKEELVGNLPFALFSYTKPGMNTAMGLDFTLNFHAGIDKDDPLPHLCIVFLVSVKGRQSNGKEDLLSPVTFLDPDFCSSLPCESQGSLNHSSLLPYPCYRLPKDGINNINMGLTSSLLSLQHQVTY